MKKNLKGDISDTESQIFGKFGIMRSGVYFSVVRHPNEHFTHKQKPMTLPTQPHAIFSTLQGTQNPDTKPNLAKS